MPAGSFGYAGLRLNGVLVWVLLGLGVTGLVLTFVGETWSWLPYAFGGVASAVVFLHWPWLRPPHQDRRGPALVLAGRTLVSLLWLVRIGLTGLCGFLLAGIPTGQDFDLRLAVGAAIGWATLVLNQLGRWMTGFPPRPDIRLTGVLSSLVGLVVITVAAGFGHQLKEATAVLLFWVPTSAYDTFYGWWPTDWFAVTLSIPVWIGWFALLVAVTGLLINLVGPVFGEGSVLTTWAQQPEAHQVSGTEAMYLRMIRQPALPREMKRMRRKVRPLSTAEHEALLAQVADVLRAATPAGWREIRAEYRAVVGHDEFDGTVITAGGERSLGVPIDAVRAQLWRLREAHYQPGYGTWFTARVHIAADGQPRLEHGGLDEPLWTRTPSRRRMSDDLRRFPIAASQRPLWLTGELYG